MLTSGCVRWSHRDQDNGAFRNAGDTMWNAGRRGNQVARTRVDALCADDESGLSGQHHIEFVGAAMRVNRLRLARLETVEADEQPVRAKTVDLGHGVRAKRGAFRQMLNQLSRF